MILFGLVKENQDAHEELLVKVLSHGEIFKDLLQVAKKAC